MMRLVRNCLKIDKLKKWHFYAFFTSPIHICKGFEGLTSMCEIEMYFGSIQNGCGLSGYSMGDVNQQHKYYYQSMNDKLTKTLELLRQYQSISIPFLQRKLNMSFQEASQLCHELIRKRKVKLSDKNNFIQI